MGLVEWKMRLTGHMRVLVRDHRIGLVYVDQRLADILEPGEHWIKRANTRVVLEDIRDAELPEGLGDVLMNRLPDLAERHLTRVRTAADQVAVVIRDGQIERVLRPERSVDLWTQAGPWDVEMVTVPEDLLVPTEMARRLNQAEAIVPPIKTTQVPPGAMVVVEIDGQIKGVLGPGTYAHWEIYGRTVAVTRIETRQRDIEVSGQEILTKDRLTLRVNIVSTYRVVDVLKSVTEVVNVRDALYTALQLAYRKTIGTRTLDELLADKVAVDQEAGAEVRAEMAKVGLEVGEIALKDVILPGEVRDLLNQVVQAQKEAEANVIRRREETNATRSLMNTAKVMADNPVTMRLKELEALERVVGKVDKISISNGTDGLLRDLVRLQD